MAELSVGGIQAALGRNPECQLGLLARERVAYAERGWLSHGNDRELFCLVRHHTWPGTGFFYGHVLRAPVVPEAEAQFPGGAWAAMIVDSPIAIDGECAEEVLANAKEWLWNTGKYQPCYAQHIDDVFALCPGFDEACQALEEMILRFGLKHRMAVIDSEEDHLRDCRHELPAPGKLDMRCMDVYGLGQWDSDGHLAGADTDDFVGRPYPGMPPQPHPPKESP